MYQKLLDTLSQEVSGVAAKRLVAHISQWHRIQASPMYREAAQWVDTTLQSWGIASQIETFSAHSDVWAWSEPMFQEWWCDTATLTLLKPDGTTQRLADYREIPLSLIPRSAPAHGEFEVVIVDGGTHIRDYDNVDVRGKLILTQSTPTAIHDLAIERFGAAGIIYDGMRSIPQICPAGDLQDAIQYISWWWWGNETRAFGFALSPRAGAELRQRIDQHTRDGEGPVRVRALVQSHFADGAVEVVTAHIPGETDEQVIVVSHLCHPAPCANDNASGAAAAMETVRALHTLITNGKLAKPKRSIRFLWMPEMTGTYAYLAAHEDDLSKTIAGLNLDMVGEDQDQCGSSWLLVRTSDALPNFTSDLLEAIREGLFGEAQSFASNGSFPLFRHAVTPYANGSDHFILTDPSVGIPTPMLIQWPDRFYHTTADTLEKVSPKSLQHAATLAGTYAYWLAQAGANETRWLAHELIARFEQRLTRELQHGVTMALEGLTPEGPHWDDRLAFWVDRQEQTLKSLQRLDPHFEPEAACKFARTIGEAAWIRVREILQDWHTTERPMLHKDIAMLVPQRRYRGPVTLHAHIHRLPVEERDQARAMFQQHRDFFGVPADVSLYWADGQRTLAYILDMVALETGIRDPEALAYYFRLLTKLELLELGVTSR
ncbi:MAG: DUF4910 domain-containing protein [Chloroflexi bacterium AL-W]|nr:DUF4910 domain-containing protein [Chloroflexi bacterium AL-N1]NOK67034.1 DUF4910 domain-containing protein [Chloroflexi bacterium AL-N10]NOK74674.1 DUF4910 domain-containing protein [Chloroflexi bacterium AL-N5]NOK81636.1 DUF4910 domain-containing protein [Chloroflexi bacterium AL-W]NOK89106.1 DUF4910 domain-containing protein [Chloroflexi bacterium AL-N15]